MRNGALISGNVTLRSTFRNIFGASVKSRMTFRTSNECQSRSVEYKCFDLNVVFLVTHFDYLIFKAGCHKVRQKLIHIHRLNATWKYPD